MTMKMSRRRALLSTAALPALPLAAIFTPRVPVEFSLPRSYGWAGTGPSTSLGVRSSAPVPVDSDYERMMKPFRGGLKANPAYSVPLTGQPSLAEYRYQNYPAGASPSRSIDDLIADSEMQLVGWFLPDATWGGSYEGLVVEAWGHG